MIYAELHYDYAVIRSIFAGMLLAGCIEGRPSTVQDRAAIDQPPQHAVATADRTRNQHLKGEAKEQTLSEGQPNAAFENKRPAISNSEQMLAQPTLDPSPSVWVGSERMLKRAEQLQEQLRAMSIGKDVDAGAPPADEHRLEAIRQRVNVMRAAYNREMGGVR